jgi:ribokinase
MTPSVIVVGSLHYDIIVHSSRMPVLGETLPGESWQSKCGGKGGNQAAEAARHIAGVTMIGCIGRDDMGGQLRRNLEDARVDIRHIRDTDERSGISLVISEQHGDYAAIIVSGANLSLSEADITHAAPLFTAGSVVVLQNEVPASVNLAAARLAHECGCRVVLNAAPARTLEPELAPFIDILVVNAIEAEMLGGGIVSDLPAAAQAVDVLGRYAPTVVVTVGGAGLVARSGDALYSLSPHAVQLVSTHGAGDAFVGALSARLAAGATIEDALAYGNAAAAVLVSTDEEHRKHLTESETLAMLHNRAAQPAGHALASLQETGLPIA